MNPEPLVVLCGATAVGKTGTAIELARRLRAEVVGADSVQIYRGLDIGSAKPTPEELAMVRHHLIDVADPDEDFDAARFMELADRAIEEIRARGKRVIVAGGTGLYIRALLHGLAPIPPVDEALRKKIAREWEEQGGAVLHERLTELDPEAAGKIHPNDRQRVTRALEVCQSSGRPLSEFWADHRFRKVRHPHVLIGLLREREELNERIALRCGLMWEQGFLDEVRGLMKQGYGSHTRSLGTLGYRHALMHLEGELDLEAARELMIRDTKAYAKRQLTWFRGLEGIHWHHPEDIQGILNRTGIRTGRGE